MISDTRRRRERELARRAIFHQRGRGISISSGPPSSRRCLSRASGLTDVYTCLPDRLPREMVACTSCGYRPGSKSLPFLLSRSFVLSFLHVRSHFSWAYIRYSAHLKLLSSVSCVKGFSRGVGRDEMRERRGARRQLSYRRRGNPGLCFREFFFLRNPYS